MKTLRQNHQMCLFQHRQTEIAPWSGDQIFQEVCFAALVRRGIHQRTGWRRLCQELARCSATTEPKTYQVNVRGAVTKDCFNALFNPFFSTICQHLGRT